MSIAMWTATTRAQHLRDGLRFASDLTDAEWAVLEPLLPPAAATGRPPAWPLRELVNAMFYVLRGGIPWCMLPPFARYQVRSGSRCIRVGGRSSAALRGCGEIAVWRKTSRQPSLQPLPSSMPLQRCC